MSDPRAFRLTDNPTLRPWSSRRLVSRLCAKRDGARQPKTVELIDDLIKATGEARVVDVAARMGVSHATVNRILSD